ncbi:Uncharacterized membrane protein YsdA, DUF1294 family [Paenibacillus sp. UNCCL117]|uniref:DUF1294 domain-containing protein n=1 Tax=unclassified Paenibacillus TaxID=185978 RepID=UPI0008848EE0|nr:MULTISPECIES: DUF1294 domain-containing protein [unclassified Paenibacillus]SDD41523.1 Uncharacterized membrane protein YsdA, DUF1294 family [Paenibacillus sp. cl123]SFW47818.1 Uncharacterized membrane protein YsdA, DUF1294 family [Paenibacillus sp. UNCCL117]
MGFGLIYIVLINLIGLILMGVDKRKARSKAWRIPEKRLFLVALAGGAAGMWMGMRWWRHKTKHNSFAIGIPVIFFLHIMVALALWGQQLPK